MTVSDEIVGAMPKLRRFAWGFSRCRADADDLVQQTVCRALAGIGSFTPGSNLLAWLYIIMRNEFVQARRKHRLEVDDTDGQHAARLAVHPPQEGRIHFTEIDAALDSLPTHHREALLMVAASGLSYEDAAALSGCAVGTMKSRVNRARHALAGM